jgi:hypothetical protein
MVVFCFSCAETPIYEYIISLLADYRSIEFCVP